MLPNDPIILLSYINTKLRDDYADLDDLCSSLGIEAGDMCGRLAPLGYTYNRKNNRFQ